MLVVRTRKIIDFIRYTIYSHLTVEQALEFPELFEDLQIVIDADQKMTICPPSQPAKWRGRSESSLDRLAPTRVSPRCYAWFRDGYSLGRSHRI
jgi:hypothetical protein